MRIQHNIAAMNSYRQLGNNNNMLSKNLEKLSSGYRINRAGDDAAGLAISEKMRAQIKGLETAQKNANDGISLVQTAEGALTEVHSMLNRMTELATQSANGTYDNDVDRANLQKEVESLKSEIDRISKSTNFNGINLLDGSLGMNTSAFTNIESTAAVKAGTVNGDMQVSNVVASKAGVAPGDAQKASFEVHLSDLTMGTSGELDIEIGDSKVSLTGLAQNATASDIADAYLAKGTSVTVDGVAYTVSKTAANNLKFEQTNTPQEGEETITPDFDVKITAKETKKSTFTIDLGDDALTTAGVATDTFSLTIAGADAAMTSAAATGAVNNNEDIAALFDGKTVAIGGETYTATASGSKLTFASANVNPGAGKVLASATASATLAGAGTGAPATTAFNVANFDDGSARESAQALNGEYNSNVINTQQSVVPSDSTQAKMTFKIDFNSLKDGSKLTIGGTDYTFKFDKDSNYTGNVIDLSDPNFGIDVDNLDTDAKSKITSETVKALATNTTWVHGNSVAATGEITLLEKVGQTNYDFSDANVVKNNVKMSTTAVDTPASTTVNIDVSKLAANDTINIDGKVYEFVGKEDDAVGEGHVKVVVDGLTEKPGTAFGDAAKALAKATGGTVDENDTTKVKISAANVDAKAPVIDSSGVKLQVGDTADEFNKVTVKVGSMNTDALGIADIDISTQTGASDAIKKIKDAINTVSSTRGDLGAVQNRLEHTINNLGVTTENITAAESRIRDTDMAAEMMQYTKNNILIQASQAMLAQANQVPQGVLQLLQ